MQQQLFNPLIPLFVKICSVFMELLQLDKRTHGKIDRHSLKVIVALLEILVESPPTL
jgi:hypothetical protein